jgi:hypothetical protein
MALIEHSTPAPTVDAARPMPKIVSVHDGRKQNGNLVTVILSTGEAVFSGIHTRTDESPQDAVALATVAALRRVLPNVDMTVDDVLHEEGRTGERFVTVTAHTKRGGVDVAVSGVRRVEGDLGVAVAEATVECLCADLA